MNRSQLEHIIRAASAISADLEIVVIGSQAIHAQPAPLPAIVYRSQEADVYPRNHPDRADNIDGAIGELSQFHQTYGYYAHGVSSATAILPQGWQERLVPLSNANTGGATGLCLDISDLVLSKFAAGRDKDLEFNRALIRQGCVQKAALVNLAASMPVDEQIRIAIVRQIETEFAAGKP